MGNLMREHVLSTLPGLHLASQPLLDLETLHPLVGFLAIVDADSVIGDQGHHFKPRVARVLVIQLHGRHGHLELGHRPEEVLLPLDLLGRTGSVLAHEREYFDLLFLVVDERVHFLLRLDDLDVLVRRRDEKLVDHRLQLEHLPT